MDSLIRELRLELKARIDPKTRAVSQRFFKEAVKPYGVKTAFVHQIAKELFARLKDRPKQEIFTLCEELWRSGMLEESFVACDWAYALRGKFTPDDFQVFERWVGGYITNWASCDTLCNHTIGAFLEAYPRFLPRLQEWAMSENRWMRRAAAVSLIVPARKGLFHDEIFAIADTLLMDDDDLVQKGYGWLLKVASQAWQEEIIQYVMTRKSSMPRTALRYAVEKLPRDLREKAMEK